MYSICLFYYRLFAETHVVVFFGVNWSLCRGRVSVEYIYICSPFQITIVPLFNYAKFIRVAWNLNSLLMDRWLLSVPPALRSYQRVTMWSRLTSAADRSMRLTLRISGSGITAVPLTCLNSIAAGRPIVTRNTFHCIVFGTRHWQTELFLFLRKILFEVSLRLLTVYGCQSVLLYGWPSRRKQVAQYFSLASRIGWRRRVLLRARLGLIIFNFSFVLWHICRNDRFGARNFLNLSAK